MWDEFESSARLLPSAPEKKEPESSAKDEKALASADDKSEKPVEPAAVIEEKAAPSVSNIEEVVVATPMTTEEVAPTSATPATENVPPLSVPAATEDFVTASVEDKEQPVMAWWNHHSDQATFPFHEAPQATFAFHGHVEATAIAPDEEGMAPTIASDEEKTEKNEPVVSAVEKQPLVEAVSNDQAVERAATSEERVWEIVPDPAPTPEDKPSTIEVVAESTKAQEKVAAPHEEVAAVQVAEPVATEDLKEDQKKKTPTPPLETKAATPAGPRDGKRQKALNSRDEGAVERPFRVKLRGSVLVLVRLPNKRSVRGAFHQLSTSGGVIHLEKPLDEKLEVELIFHLQEKTIRNKAQMLFPMWATQGWMQPFRFIDLAEKSRDILDASLKSFLSDGAKGATAGA